MLACLLLLLCGCQSAKESEAITDISAAEPAPVQSESGAQSAAAPSTSEGSFAIIQTAAYAYEENGVCMLYGAVEYENTGKSPVYLSEASFSFSGTNSAVMAYEPVLAAFDPILPGERSYTAAWFPGEGFTPGEEVDLHVKLRAQGTQEKGCPLTVDDVFFADNYPAFSTMTGTLCNEGRESCALNMIYAGLYDKDGKFLGVWYFSQNAQLDGGDCVRFTTHLRSFPLNHLAEADVQCKCRAFGFH